MAILRQGERLARLGATRARTSPIRPRLVCEPKIALDNIEAGKIENFEMVFGVTPRPQFSNSSSDDQQPLQYVNNAPGLRLSVAILHDAAAREYAYGPATGLPNSPVGTPPHNVRENPVSDVA